MIMKKLLTFCCFALACSGYSQTTTTTTTDAPAEKEWEVNVYGFIRTDYIWDTRKSSQVREGNLNLYPLDAPAAGNDFNAVGSSNFLSVVSRLGTKVKGPNVWGAKISGTLEGDFFGNIEGSSIGLFRLRHAYVNMDWSKVSLTMGQTWYPTFIPEVFPGVANFNTGIMFNPFGWASQIKAKYNFTKELSFAVTAYKEREFTATVATIGTQNSASINSALPTFHGQLQFKKANWIAGLGAEIKTLQPLTEFTLTPSNTKVGTSERVKSSSFVGYVKYSNDYFCVKGYGITGTNLQSLVMLGGFVGYNAPDKVEQYEASKTTAFWVDIASSGKKIAPGIFFGTTSNNGTNRTLAAGETAKYYMRGVTGTRVIDNVMRLSGRVDFKQNKFRVTPEVEYTKATWADLNTNGSAAADLNARDVKNVRYMISCAYSF